MTTTIGCAESRAKPAQRDFWERVGNQFPSLKGAPSTAYYLECEQRLFTRFTPDLRGKRVLKTDLWDEAKNTEILRWVAEQGAEIYGVDLAVPTVQASRDVLREHAPALTVADVRSLPFVDSSFDLIYSMGTIEHFPEYRVAAQELFRVLRPGGRAIIGVPNKHDPFLRPMMVEVMNRLGLYAYGLEKSFTAAELTSLLESCGFRVVDMSGILFIPGWLRMLDLLLHVRDSRLKSIVGGAVKMFASISRRCPGVLRHGYLIAAVGERPSAVSTNGARSVSAPVPATAPGV